MQLPGELFIPVPTYKPNVACIGLDRDQKIEYKLKALDTENLPPWAEYSEAGKSMTFAVQKEVGLAGQSRKFTLEAKFDGHVVTVSTFTIFFRGPEVFA